MIKISEADILCSDAKQLITELNQVLEKITGSSGAGSFDYHDMEEETSVFLIAYEDGTAMGCGAIRAVSDHIAEIKRVYARPNHSGIGKAILDELEKRAKLLHFSELILETRCINQKAVNFYLKNQYIVCENYGKYIGRSDAVCFHKIL